MARILVTGSEGDVGSVLLPQLAKRLDAVGFDLRPHDGALNVIQGDLTDYDSVAAAAQGMDAIVHVAALLPHRPHRLQADYVDVNVAATTNVLQAALDAGVKRVVYCSTVWASGHGYTEPYQPIDEDVPCAPICIYGQTKWLGELMSEYFGREHGLETVVIRFCGYNPVEGYREDGSIDWENADVPALLVRYVGMGYKLMNPADLGNAFALAAEEPAAAGGRFVVGCYTPYVAEDAEELASAPAKVVARYYPGAVELFEELGLEIPAVQYFFSHERARDTLGFRSQHDLSDVVRMYREWRSA